MSMKLCNVEIGTGIKVLDEILEIVKEAKKRERLNEPLFVLYEAVSRAPYIAIARGKSYQTAMRYKKFFEQLIDILEAE